MPPLKITFLCWDGGGGGVGKKTTEQEMFRCALEKTQIKNPIGSPTRFQTFDAPVTEAAAATPAWRDGNHNHHQGIAVAGICSPGSPHCSSCSTPKSSCHQTTQSRRFPHQICCTPTATAQTAAAAAAAGTTEAAAQAGTTEAAARAV